MLGEPGGSPQLTKSRQAGLRLPGQCLLGKTHSGINREGLRKAAWGQNFKTYQFEDSFQPNI